MMEDERALIVRSHEYSMRMLIAAALFVLGLTLSIGAFVYYRTVALAHSSDVVIQTQQELSALKALGVRLDELAAAGKVYALSGQLADYRKITASSLAIGDELDELNALAEQWSGEAARLTLLSGCVAEFTEHLESFASKSAPFDAERLGRCRQIAMQSAEQRQRLLRTRTELGRHETRVSLLTGAGAAAIAAAVEVILFALLLHYSMRARRASETIFAKHTQLEEKTKDVLALAQARDNLQLCTSVEGACRSAAEFAARITPGSAGWIGLIENSRRVVESVATWGEHLTLPEHFPTNSCCGLRSGNLRWRRPESSMVHCTHFQGEPPREYCCIPMSALGETMGVAYIECSPGLPERQLHSLASLLQLTAMAIANINLRQTLETQSFRDPLTGLFNRRFMETSLDKELSRATRKGSLLAVFMIDADHFKHFNDSFGHEAGDYVLRALSDLFRSSVRYEDVVCRYGGEEFVIILPDISREWAIARAESLRRAVAEHKLLLGPVSLREVTISLGVGMFPSDGATSEQLLRAADANLYRAKQLGRNRVVAEEASLTASVHLV